MTFVEQRSLQNTKQARLSLHWGWCRVSFHGLEEDGSEIYDVKEEAIARAKMLKQWQGFDAVMIQRKWMQHDWSPGWLGRLSRGTWFEFLFYEEVK